MLTTFRLLLVGFLLLLFGVSSLSGQESLEPLFEIEEPSEEDADYLQELQDLIDHPLNLNTVKMDDLMRIPYLTKQLAAAILQYRQENRRFQSKVELKNVPGITPDLYDQIRPFVTARKLLLTRPLQRVNADVRWRWLQRDPAYADSDSDELKAILDDEPAAIYQRTKVSFGQWLKLNFLTEKDRGEDDLTDLQQWSVELELPRRPLRLNFGYYRLMLGQGLLFSPQAGVFKGGEVVTGHNRSGVTFKPYTSTGESAGFLGAAAQLKLGPVNLTTFYSDRERDASPAYFTSSEYDDFWQADPAGEAILTPYVWEDNGRIYFNLDDLTDPDRAALGEDVLTELTPYAADRTILSFDDAGLHRSASEIARQNQVREKIIGAHGRFHFRGFNSVGVTYYQSEFDKLVYPKYSERTFYDFRGDELSGWSVDTDLYFDRFNVFGEWAQSVDYGQAVVFGATFDADPIEFAAVIRDYDPDYYALHSYGFADSKGATENEQGEFLGFRWRLPNKIKWRAYFDFFRHPFRRYTTAIPDEGNDYYSEVEIPLGRKFSGTIRLKSKTKGDTKDGSDVYPLTKRSYRVQLDWQPDKIYQLRFRYEHVEADSDDLDVNDSGMVLYGDLKVTPIPRWQVYSRVAFFDTESSFAPVYTFENDLLGVLKNTYLAGEGRRWYLLSKFSIVEKRLIFSAKFAQTTHLNPVEAALNVPASTRETVSEWGAQLDFRY